MNGNTLDVKGPDFIKKQDLTFDVKHDNHQIQLRMSNSRVPKSTKK